MANRDSLSVSRAGEHPFLGDMRIADLSLVVYMVCVTAFSSGSLPVQAARVFLVCGAFTELKREKYIPTKFELWQLLFVAFVAASSLWAFDEGSAKEIASTVLINAICMICLVYILRCDFRRIPLLLVCMAVAPILLMFNVALADGLMAFSVSRSTENFSANTVGMTAAFGVCLAGFCLFERKILSRSVSFSIMAIDLAIVVLSASRKAILMVLLAVSVYIILKSRGNGMKVLARLMIAVLIVLVGYFLVMNVPFLYNMVGYRIESMIVGFLGGEGSDASTSTRMGLIEHGMEFFQMSPIIGHGGANFSALDAAYFHANAGYYAHNNFVEMLTDYGVVGFCLYYWMYAMLIVATVRRIKKASSLQITVLALLIVLLVMEYGFVSYYDRFFQVFIAFAFCVLIRCPAGFSFETELSSGISHQRNAVDVGAAGRSRR